MRSHLNIVSRVKKLFISSPDKEKSSNGGNPVADFDRNNKPVGSGFGFRGLGFGSKGETYFDSRAWFDSDCEDDFFSVNGDFTPSRGSTPIHPFSVPGTPKSDRTQFMDIFPDAESESSPTERKMKLPDLLMGVGLTNEQNANIDQSLNSRGGSPYASGADTKHKKEKTRKVGCCCLPSLGHSRGLTDRRKPKVDPEYLSS